MIKVFIVDDHKMVIEGMQLLLQNDPDITIIGSALSGDEALERIPEAAPDVVLLDINMPDKNGIDTCKELLKSHPEMKVVSLSMHKESSLIKLMLDQGAKGYVLKNAGKHEVTEAIKKVHQGGMYLDDTVNEIILNSAVKKKTVTSSPFPTLSRREKEVLHCILEEMTTQEIAERLHISFGTVETHRRNMLMKTGARNTAGLVRVALEYELHK
ncbi:response regulator transcription factor [Altibacter sp. HG106]|uniref:response regulator transcription factor n=1 Tax=Altibacter sp. HG106 TaxID=3023937 RepID=UPI002350452F|nr:response regulator transcription factor [Altibacter sp. HG106]MDC7996038.1 response regulator transcription factor [Altibacter sp. HG106]